MTHTHLPDEPQTRPPRGHHGTAPAPDGVGAGARSYHRGMAPRSARRLDGRTLGICVCLAVIAALVAGLVATKVTHEDSSGDHLSLTSTKVDGKELLASKVTTVENRSVPFSTLTGAKPVLVNLWQQSCTPCVKEMPLLDQLHRTTTDVSVLGIDVQDDLGLAQGMAKKTRITYPWVRDPAGDFFAAAKGVGLPTSILLSPAGKVLGTKQGAFTSESALKRWVAQHLA